MRLRALATPSRVADATRMLAQAIEAGFPDEAGDMSLVVENKDMRVGLAAWNEKALDAANRLTDFLENPTQRIVADDTTGMAEAIEEYCREAVELEPTFWRPEAKKPFRVVDAEFLNHLRVVREERVPDQAAAPKLLGSTTTVSPVLRVGRLTERASLRARIRWAGTAYDIQVETDVFAAFCEAAKHGRPMKIQLVVAWLQTPEGLTFSKVGTKAIGIAEAESPLGLINSELARLPPLMSTEEAKLVYAGLQRGDDDE
jgi:hypothetical protein